MAHGSPRRLRPLGMGPAAAALLALSALAPEGLAAQTLRGSSASLDLQNDMARLHDFTYLRSAEQVSTFVELGRLVRITPTADYDLHDVSFPFARPEVEVFLGRLGAQYRQACRQKLVVTSLTRPLSHQPANASPRSVHPTGMAIDLRLPTDSRCRSWLENTLIQLERSGVLDATRETRPPHYHVVLFPSHYADYLERQNVRIAEAPSAPPAGSAAPAPAAPRVGANLSQPPAPRAAPAVYTVRRGDSLWTIAQKLGTTVQRLQAENDLRGSRIYVGQVIVVPAR